MQRMIEGSCSKGLLLGFEWFWMYWVQSQSLSLRVEQVIMVLRYIARFQSYLLVVVQQYWAKTMKNY